MRLLKRLAFVLLILAVALGVGIVVVGTMVTPKLSDVEAPHAPVVTVEDAPVREAARKVVTVRDDATSSGTVIVQDPGMEDWRAGEVVWSGTVTDNTSGQPIAGASVELLRRGFDFDNMRTESGPKAAVKTDAEGRYEITVNPALDKTLLLAPYSLQATAEGHQAAAHNSYYEMESAQVDFSLRPGGSIAGRVQDERGAPIRDVIVGSATLFPSDGTPDDYKSLPRYMTVTSADGRFELRGLHGGAMYHVPARARGYAATYSPETKVGEQNLIIVMKPSNVGIDATVRTADGRPVANATVWAYAQWEQGISRNDGTGPPSARAKTDEKGQCALDGIAPTVQYRVECVTEATTTEPGQRVGAHDVTVMGGSRQRVEFSLKPVTVASGIFVDADSGAPIAGVGVSSEYYENVSVNSMTEVRRRVNETLARPEVITGADGRFAIPTATSQFFCRIPADYLNGDENISLGQCSFAGDGTNLQFKLKRAVTVPILVLAQDNLTPSPGVAVSWYDRDRNNSYTDLVRTDANGRCEMPASPGAHYSIRAYSKEGWAYIASSDPIAAAPTELRMTLLPFATISGRITLAGQPFPNLRVNANAPSFSSTEASTAADGTYTLEIAPSGPVSVYCSGWAAYADTVQYPPPYTLRPGEIFREANIDISPRGPILSLIKVLKEAFQ
ncbi:hypothetical protein BH09SUM1_BH09SUM1_14740 [soil metagenome]